MPVALALLLLGLSACADAPASPLPDEYLGRWYYLGSSGGITGGGLGDEPTGFIVIHGDMIDRHAEDGTLLSTRTFTASLGPTIFSTEDEWVLDAERAVPEVIRLSDGGRTMTLSENVHDGYTRVYDRSR